MSLAEKTGAATVNLIVETAYAEFSYAVKPLGIHRYFELATLVPLPERSKYESVKPGTSERILADKDGYEAELARVSETRTAYRVAAALFDGGEEFPSDVQNSDRARGEWVLNNMAVDIRAAIGNYLARAIDGRTAALKSTAEGFRNGLVSGSERGGAAGTRLDVEPVASHDGSGQG